jgi:hypothetical protein
MKKLLTITSAMLFLILSLDVSTAQNLSYSKVPRGSTYVVLDNNGKEIAKFKAGQKTTMGGDCVIVKCPDTFDPRVTCWKCVKLTAE